MPLVKAGSDIEAYCTKCKMLLAHIIVAVRGGAPARVECKTCRGVHTFRARVPDGAPRKAPGPRLSEFDRLVASKNLSQAAPYRPNVCFTGQQVIDHQQFGIGIVTQALADKKIEVVFKNGTKVLVHDR